MKKQRVSRTWMVKLEGVEEEFKIVGVSSEEEAMAKAKELGHNPVSARPMRKFKQVEIEVVTQTPASLPAEGASDGEPSAL